MFDVLLTNPEFPPSHHRNDGQKFSESIFRQPYLGDSSLQSGLESKFSQAVAVPRMKPLREFGGS